MNEVESDGSNGVTEDKVMLLTMVSVYRTVMKSISQSANGTLIWGGLLLGLWYMVYARNGMPKWEKLPIYAYIHLAVAVIEVGIGLWEKFAPSLWCILANVFLLSLFFFSNGWRAFQEYQRQGRPDYLSVGLGLYMLFLAIQQFRNWLQLRSLLTVIPSRAQLKWFDGLVKEVRLADPENDSTALKLKTDPRWNAKLLGDISFFVNSSGEVTVTDRDGVELVLLGPADNETMTRPALLVLDGDRFGPFPIDGVNIRNFREWKGDDMTV
jgi:hypothetical protein